MLSEFSEDGRYFAHLTKKTKLKIWDTSTNKVLQKFTPDSPCTCLQFVQSHGKNNTPRKKKKHQSSVGIALGTSTGNLLFYSISEASLNFTIDSRTNQSVNCLTWSNGSLLYGGVQENVVAFHLDKQIADSGWKSGEEKLTSILAIPQSSHLLTASCEIKLWDASEKQLLKVFPKHNHEVTLLRYIPLTQEKQSAGYLVCGTKSDHYLNVWSLNSVFEYKDSIAKFVLADLPSGVTLCTHDGITNLTAVTRNGVVQIFHHTFNGKRKKRQLKPDVTIHIIPETENDETVARIPFIGAAFATQKDLSLLLCHGSAKLTFESVELDDLVTGKQVLCWTRKDYRTKKTSQVVVQNGDITMESRLKNMNLNRNTMESEKPNPEDLPKLLLAGLRKGKRGILIDILNSFNEDVIKSTLKKLPATENTLFLQEIIKMIADKLLISGNGTIWLKRFIELNVELLVSDTKLSDKLNTIGANIEERILLYSPLQRLNGKLDLLNAQISKNLEENAEDDDNFLLVNAVPADSDSDINIDGLEDSDEGNEWMEEEEESLNEEEEGGSDISISIESLESDDDDEEEKLNNVKHKSRKSKYQDMEID